MTGNDDTLAVWHDRCRKDAEILDEAISGLMDWFDAHDLGRWGVTGPATLGQAMAAAIELTLGHNHDE